MPVMDGFEVLPQLRDMCDDSRPDRVILGKPFWLDDLRRLLLDELDRF